MTRIARQALRPDQYHENREWRPQVLELLELNGWDYRYFTQRSKRSPWGMPDIFAVRRRDRRLLFAELKGAETPVTPDQYGVLELLLDVSDGGWTNGRQGEQPRSFASTFWQGIVRVDVELWRPGDIDRVIEVLR